MKTNTKKITLIGGGGINWTPMLLGDICLKKCIEHIEFYLYDINLENAKQMAKYGEMINRYLQTKHDFVPTSDPAKALDGADFVVIIISTGGLNAMQNDLSIPEKYGIFATVGDTVGPGGWSRNIRNIPVFKSIGKQIEKYCPNAVVMNYTNPMASLTATLCKSTTAHVVGLCHAFSSNIKILTHMFEIEDKNALKFQIGGINHFFWMLDLKIRGKDGKKMVLGKMKNKNFQKLVPVDDDPMESKNYLTDEIIRFFNEIPFFGDRHTCEFFPHIMTKGASELTRLGIIRTSVKDRKENFNRRMAKIGNILSGKEELKIVKSGEICSDIIEAFTCKQEIIEVIDVPNKGQIQNLPQDAVVETMGTINPKGFHPLSIGKLPQIIANLCEPFAMSQKELVDGMFAENREKVLHALYSDPTLSFLNFDDRKSLAQELMKVNFDYLPDFLK